MKATKAVHMLCLVNRKSPIPYSCDPPQLYIYMVNRDGKEFGVK